VLDGRVLDDPAWQGVPTLVEFWQTAPDAGQPSSERTEVRIVYTESAIYVGVVLLDRDPSGLTTSDSRRDSPLDDRLQQANTGVFIVYADSHLADESPFRPSNAELYREDQPDVRRRAVSIRCFSLTSP
jgi:hypothetical protein